MKMKSILGLSLLIVLLAGFIPAGAELKASDSFNIGWNNKPVVSTDPQIIVLDEAIPITSTQTPDADVADPGSAATTVTVTEDKTVTAHFTLVTDQALIDALEASLRDDLLNPYYLAALDSFGGFVENRGSTWEPEQDEDKFVVTQARYTWTAAKAAQFYAGDPKQADYLQSAAVGFAFLQGMWGYDYGGGRTGIALMVDRDGSNGRIGNKEPNLVYGHAFALYAAAAYYSASGEPNALTLAVQAYNFLDDNAYDTEYGGYYITLDDMRKNTNVNLHVLEALTEFYEALPAEHTLRPEVADRISELLGHFHDHVIHYETPTDCFTYPLMDREWYSTSNEVRPGHDIELAFLMIEAIEALGQDPLTSPYMDTIRDLVDFTFTHECYRADGGLYYAGTYDSGVVNFIDTQLQWWPQAEALNGICLMSVLFPDELFYADNFNLIWSFIENNFIDPVNHGWVELAGQMDIDKAYEWHTNYHNGRALMNCLEWLSYGLTMAVEPSGGGTTTPEEGVHRQTSGSVVVITAVPNEGYEFSHWTGGVVDPNSANTIVIMDGDKTVTAHFTTTYNPTTVGTLLLVPTCQSIGVYSNFSGDINENNQAYLEYRESGTTPWLPAPALTVDRRDTVVSGGATVSNPYQNQYRGSVILLEANTSYDVRVTYIDEGAYQSVEGTVSTYDDNPPSNGNTYYVATTGENIPGGGSFDNPWRTIQYAANRVGPGDIVRIMPGTYYEQVSVPISGNENNYITFMSHDTNNRAEIIASGYGTFRLIDVSHIRLKELDIAGDNDDASCVFIQGSNADRNIIEDCNLATVGTNWWVAGVVVYDGATNTLIQRNVMTTTGVAEEEGPFGVLLNRTDGGTVIRNNTIIGSFKDGIGGAPNFSINGGPYHDSDINDNYVQGIIDDCIESEGGNINVRIWGNETASPNRMGIAIGSTIIGPIHIFRNTLQGNWDAAFKMGHESDGTTYLYHNTIYTTEEEGCGPTDFAGYAGIGNVISRNNIYQVGKYVIEIIGSDLGGNDYDYDNMFTTWGLRFVKWHNIIYTSLSLFQTATGQELHAISADSEFTDPANYDFTLQPTSPCIDQGILITGFNDANSPWPYSGAAPDLGAYECAVQPTSVTTMAASSIEAITAVLNGMIEEDGGEACEYRFEYDTDAGEPYAYHTEWEGSVTSGQSFACEISELNPGMSYYFRAQARNGAGTVSGAELVFTTDAEVISITITDYGGDGVRFGNGDPGQTGLEGDCGDLQGAVTVEIGEETNVNVKIEIMGEDFGGPATIDVKNVTYNDTNSSSGAKQLTDTYETCYTVFQPISDDYFIQIYMWMAIPAGTPPGTYTSNFYFRAVRLE